MKEAVIVAGARTPVGRAVRGSLANTRPDDLAALTVKETLKRANNYDGNIDDVIIGNAMPEAEQGMNMANNIAGLAGLKKKHLRTRLTVIVLQVYKVLPMGQREL